MPSLITLAMREQLRLLRPLLTHADIEACRRMQDRLGELGARAASSKTDIEHVPFPDFEAAAVTPAGCSESRRAVLYLHGGGYTAGSLAYSLGFGSVLAVHCNLPVLCAAYRLAPEHPFPAALEDAVSAYLCLLQAGLEPRNISLAGESAGGGLICALCLWLREHAFPLPGRIVLMSPWVDLTFSGGSLKENAHRDPSLSEEALRGYARMYAGGDTENPLISPVLGDLHGFPPALIFAGGDEILRDDAQMLHDRLTACGVPSVLHIEPGLWHAYVLFGVPEARQALDRIRDFLLSGESMT